MIESKSAGGSVPSDKGVVPVPAPALDRDSAWREYVRRIAGRDQAGLTALYDESSSLVYGLALRVLSSQADAEEVAMDVYNQVWRSAVGYQESRGSVIAWLATMTRTRAIDRLRSQGLRGRSEQHLSEVEREPFSRRHADTEGDAVRRLDAQRVRDSFESLPPGQREVMVLTYFSGMSHSEIAEHLGLPIGTVKTRIRLGMLRLRELLRVRI